MLFKKQILNFIHLILCNKWVWVILTIWIGWIELYYFVRYPCCIPAKMVEMVQFLVLSTREEIKLDRGTNRYSPLNGSPIMFLSLNKCMEKKITILWSNKLKTNRFSFSLCLSLFLRQFFFHSILNWTESHPYNASTQKFM